MEIAFAGPITAEVRDDLRRLYIKRNPLFPVAYALMGTFAFLMMLIPNEIATLLKPLSSEIKTPILMSLWDKLFWLAVSIFFFVAAFALTQIWYRWWWPQWERDGRLAGRISLEGVYWGTEIQPVPWSSFQAIRLSDKAALLYLAKGYALPLHRTLFLDDAAWREFVDVMRAANVSVTTVTLRPKE
jgi:hypothetical protein